MSWFKRKNIIEKIEVINKKLIVPEKTTAEIIEEIHDSFYTEVDKLLESAKVSKSIESQKDSLIEKRDKLFALGFTNTAEVQEANIAIENLKKSERLIKTINYFSQKYPLYKFITEESVIKICEKYNLIYGDASKYIGKVPDKNLKEMQNFKVDIIDVCFSRTYSRFNNTENYISFMEFKQEITNKISEERHLRGYSKADKEYPIVFKEEIEKRIKNKLYHNYYSFKKYNLEIAAPLKDFDMENYEIRNFKISKIEIPDPVVLQPVFFEGQKHYLIVTAWGIEASDEAVVNTIYN